MSSQGLATVLFVILGVIVLLPGLAMFMMGFGMMGRGAWSGWFGGFGLMMVLLFITGIALIVLGLSRRETKLEEPLELLKRRLARGEITKEQYEELKRTLQ